MTLSKNKKGCILDLFDKLDQLQSDMIHLSDQVFFSWLKVITRWIFEIALGKIRKVMLRTCSMFLYEVNCSRYIFESIAWRRGLSFAISAC